MTKLRLDLSGATPLSKWRALARGRLNLIDLPRDQALIWIASKLNMPVEKFQINNLNEGELRNVVMYCDEWWLECGVGTSWEDYEGPRW
jgi:hypothetical protein